MQQIGVVKLVQIQTGVIKQGQKPNTYYEPSYIQVVDELLISPIGVIATNSDGMKIVDIHHRDHPGTRFNGRDNGVSIGFTRHYDLMRSKYGERIREGVAGENIIIEAAQPYSIEELGKGLVFENAVTGERFSCSIPRIV